MRIFKCIDCGKQAYNEENYCYDCKAIFRKEMKALQESPKKGVPEKHDSGPYLDERKRRRKDAEMELDLFLYNLNIKKID